jgi:hypothetical protein
MTLYDELYFEITFHGDSSEIKKIASFIKSGDLDEFFENAGEYIVQNDTAEGTEKATLVFSTDDYGIEIDEFEAFDFLDVICRAAKNLYVSGSIYDVDEDEYEFVSPEGDSYYMNARKAITYNDELDEVAREEENDEEG